MASFFVQRLAASLVVIIGVSLIIFVLVRLTGDPAAMLLPIDATAEDYAALRQKLGLDRPLPEQYYLFLTSAVHGDFGTSIRHKLPALPIVLQRLPATLELILAGLLVSFLIAIPAGIVSAVKRNSSFDNASRVVAFIGQGMPTFWMGMLLIMLFSVKLRWFPFAGRGGVKHLILPAITLGAFAAPLQMRILRSGLLEVLNKDYIRTARAKGLSERKVIFGHSLKNAAIPFVTIVGLQIGSWFAGSLITETVFAYPGIGLLAVNAMKQRDFPVVQAYVLVVAVGIVTINFLIDVLYMYLDPRIRYV